MWKFNRKLARLTCRLYSNSGASSPVCGKKKLPQNLKFVVLNPTQSGLVKNDQKLARHQPSSRRAYKDTGNDDNDDFGSKLLVFEKQNSLDSALNSIRLKKPTNTSLSSLEYNALLQTLTSSYNRHQLREFISSNHPDSPLHLTHWKKSKLSQYIIGNIWNCHPESTPSTPTGIKSTSLTFQFDTPREIFLLLITQNGKILTNFNKLGLTFIISIQDNELTVKGSSSLLKYVEISLNKIWSNITQETVDIHASAPSKDLVNLIQKESHTFFEYLPESPAYKISALSPKKISMAKALLLNAISSNPHASQQYHTIESAPPTKLASYPFNNTLENLDWLNKSRDWSRLQSTVPRPGADLGTSATAPQVTDAQINQYNAFLSANAPSPPTPSSISQCLSMTLGYSLQSPASPSVFQPLVHKSFISKLLSLSNFTESSSSSTPASLDQHLITNPHHSFVQLNFTPMPPISNPSPPFLQVWFETDEFDNIVTASMRPLLKLQENSIVLRTPQSQTDYKITSDYIQDLLPNFDQTHPDAWLSDQKGLQEFLVKSHWKLNKYQNLMKKITIALPNSQAQQYQLTDILTHRVLNLQFPAGSAQDKYIIQYSDINRGFVNNGSYRQLDFININPNETSLKTFINDVLNF
ncbi:hypothetical protein SEUBUCD646_0L02020 [Saccharomyces eubayanus]|uniref:SLS1-like protein n=1 Tax=Saccharomyces eubayanus TaxID=1080349 RepID=A0ABN8VJL6_SACEU|nr:hypothetical protein SEUBUCD650_0L01990 [Saccharomyces eubayanus]CAI1605004.1 hypothetical protein SEUBUCD646_0L02020 [Saccharomyces eubayanus]